MIVESGDGGRTSLDVTTVLTELGLGLGAGLALGAMFFGMLWWTVRRLPRAEHPIVLTLGSLVIRVGVSVLVFAWLARREGPPIAVGAGLCGFVLVRALALRSARRQQEVNRCS